MNRSRTRGILLATLRIGVGLVLFAVLSNIIVGETKAAGLAAFVGLLAFMCAEGWYAWEVNEAISVVNARVDEQVIRDVHHDRRIEALEGGATPPHGISTLGLEGKR